MNFRDVVKDAKRQGFRVTLTKKSHWEFLPPDPTKEIVIAPGTPSDKRSILNLIAQLRRSGFIWRGH
jgi:predicted RNA binding protein YcfA (HicA-like mRNA interferase family)